MDMQMVYDASRANTRVRPYLDTASEADAKTGQFVNCPYKILIAWLAG